MQSSSESRAGSGQATGHVRFAKGHGTGNDFVVLPDPDAVLDLPAARVAALCDRHVGLGADGVLRVARWAALAATTADVPPAQPGVTWFMDYRNADGSIAEMCGNGVRVFARYLARAGWEQDSSFAIGTRDGVRTVTFADGDTAAGDVSVAMGPAIVGAAGTAEVAGHAFPGVAVDVGNPHLVCVTDRPIDELDLTHPPKYDPALFPDGVNIEFVSPLADDTVTMRVHERGVGETRSCGTGTVAAVAGSLAGAGRPTGTVTVATPGGILRVTVEAPGAGGATVLSGPAVIVAEGEIDAGWWAAS